MQNIAAGLNGTIHVFGVAISCEVQLPQGLLAVTAGCWRSPYENVAGVSTPSRRSIYGQDDIFLSRKDLSFLVTNRQKAVIFRRGFETTSNVVSHKNVIKIVSIILPS